MVVHIPKYMYTGIKYKMRRNNEVFESIKQQVLMLNNFTNNLCDRETKACTWHLLCWLGGLW